MRSRLILVVALTAVLTATTSVVASGVLTSDPGPFTGCLGVKTNKGLVYNVAAGSAPYAPCSRGDVQIAFSNAQGPQGEQGPQGLPGPQGPQGDPGDLSALTSAIEALEARIKALEGSGSGTGDDDGDGYTVALGDCDDSDPAIHPGATEVANGLDDDCDGELGSWVAYGGPLGTEGIGVCMAGIVSELPDGTLGPIVGEATPGVEVADNGLDDDCDGSTDEALGDDADGDGYTVALGDCDDANPAIHPGALEVVNGLDDNCDGALASWPAYSGPAGTEGVGVCHAGVQHEKPDGEVGAIVGEVTPAVELADNGLDDDCDGLTDEP